MDNSDDVDTMYKCPKCTGTLNRFFKWGKCVLCASVFEYKYVKGYWDGYNEGNNPARFILKRMHHSHHWYANYSNGMFWDMNKENAVVMTRKEAQNVQRQLSVDTALIEVTNERK